MLKTTLATLAICLLACLCMQMAEAQTPQAKGAAANSTTATPGVVGDWRGTLTAGGQQFRLVLKVTRTPAGGLAATLDSPDQSATDLLLEDVTYADRILRFEFRAGPTPAVFEGALSRDGTEVAGSWQQGVPYPLVFTREGANANAAPPAPVATNTRGRVQLQPCGLPNLTKDALCGQYEVPENRAAQAAGGAA